MDERFIRHAEEIRERLVQKNISPAEFRATLLEIPYVDRDAWVDALLQFDGCGEDSPELPQGCVPYLPCAVEALLQIADRAPVQATDVFVDIGSGAGRAAILMHFLTGAATIGIEVQSAHLQKAQEIAARLRLSAVTFVQGDATEVVSACSAGTVFFLYCPFSGSRLVRFLGQLENLAQKRSISVCTVDLPLPETVWLELRFSNDEDVRIYQSRKTSL